jgi:hypothetical protein
MYILCHDIFYKRLQLRDCMDLRSDFKFLNINENVIDSRDFFEVGPNCILHYAMSRYGSHSLMCLNKPMGARE